MCARAQTLTGGGEKDVHTCAKTTSQHLGTRERNVKWWIDIWLKKCRLKSKKIKKGLSWELQQTVKSSRGTQTGSSLLKTPERGPARGRDAASQLLAAFGGLGLRGTELHAFLTVLSVSFPLLWKELPGTPPTCPFALFLSLVFPSFLSPFSDESGSCQRQPDR